MKIAAIVCEYNPFHQGHLIPIQYARDILHCDVIIGLMSGDFVQRGNVAQFDKFLRGDAALKMGVDLVLQIPTPSVLSSAEFYAEGALKLLVPFSQIDYLVFGTECKNPDLLSKAGFHRNKIEDSIHEELLKLQGKGYSYGEAKTMLLSQALQKEGFSQTEISELLHGPNNILGIHYMAAAERLQLNLTCVPVPRQGGSHGDSSISEDYASATSIRSAIDSCDSADIKKAISHVPEELQDIYLDYIGNHLHLSNSDLDVPMLLSLTAFQKETPNSDLQQRIQNLSSKFMGFDSFSEEIKTKNRTYTSVQRELCNLLLKSIVGPAYLRKDSLQSVSYLRVLGATKAGMVFLGSALKDSEVSIITSPGSEGKKLSSDARNELHMELQISEFTRLLRQRKSGLLLPEETTRKFIIQ